MNNHYRSKASGFPLCLQPLFLLAFYVTHLSAEFNSFFHSCLNNTLIFCYLDSTTLTKLGSSFMSDVKCSHKLFPWKHCLQYSVLILGHCHQAYRVSPCVKTYLPSSSSLGLCLRGNPAWSPHKPAVLCSPAVKSTRVTGRRIRTVRAHWRTDLACNFTLLGPGSAWRCVESKRKEHRTSEGVNRVDLENDAPAIWNWQVKRGSWFWRYDFMFCLNLSNVSWMVGHENGIVQNNSKYKSRMWEISQKRDICIQEVLKVFICIYLFIYLF